MGLLSLQKASLWSKSWWSNMNVGNILDWLPSSNLIMHTQKYFFHWFLNLMMAEFEGWKKRQLWWENNVWIISLGQNIRIKSMNIRQGASLEIFVRFMQTLLHNILHPWTALRWHSLRFSIKTIIQPLHVYNPTLKMTIFWNIRLQHKDSDKLGIFHASQISRCLDPHQK